MNRGTTIGCGLLAGAAACMFVPSVATATDCSLPGSPGTGMAPVLDVQGDLSANRTGGYLQIPFTVPAGANGIQVRYSYDQPGGGCGGSPNTLDMGVYEPRANPSSPAFEQTDRRGWSGSAVKNLAIAENGFSDEAVYNGGNGTDQRKNFVDGRTTRAYRPGPIPEGDWAVELGIAYVDPGDSDGIHYHVEVLTSTDSSWGDDPYSPSGPPAATINETPGWYTGDVHVHGEMEPGNATMNQTFAAAFGPGGAGLDFVTLVDHNNNIAHNDMKAQADVYPDNLVIPGVEETTYKGHWNNEGSSHFADFRGGPVYGVSGAPPYDDSDVAQIQAGALPKDGFANALTGGGWTQINHPATYKDDPSGCRGCAWTYSDGDTDFSKVDAIEISNSLGALSKGPFTLDAIAYYEHALAGGAHIAAVGSSDAHKAASDVISHVGEGVTVVHSEGLGKEAIIDAVKADHTYVKPFGPSGPDVSLEATDEGGDGAIIGDSVSGSSIALSADVNGISASGRPGSWELELLQDGVVIDSTPISGDGIHRDYDVSETGRYSIEVTRTPDATYVEDYTTPIWVTVVPSNEFEVKKAKLNKKKGTAKLPVKVPGGGSLKLSGKSLAADSAKPKGASKVSLEVKPKGKLKKKLKKQGKLTVKPSIKFTPDGGDAATRKATVKLKYKKRKR
jgi:hypothetical protein